MLFGMRRWAVQALELAAIEVTSPTGTQMISMMVQGAKVYRRDFMKTPPGIDDLDGVVMAACSVAGNPSAVNRLAREVGVPPGEAQTMLARLQQAAETLYVQERPRGHLTQPPWSVGSSLAAAQPEAESADRQAILEKVDKEILYINEMWHANMKAIFSVYIAHYLQLFIQKFGSQDAFADAPTSSQMSFIHMLVSEVADFNVSMGKLPQKEGRYNDLYCQAFAGQFFAYLAAALAERDVKLQAKLAPFLREHARTGWAIGTSGAPRPACLMGPLSNWTK